MDNKLISFSYRLLNVSSSENIEQINAAYSLWKDVWRQTFHELENLEFLASDGFHSCHEVGALFEEGRPLGLVLHKWWDFQLNATPDHSYFGTYPKDVVKQVVERHGPRVMTMSYLTVAPEWRRTFSGLPVSDILISLTVKRFLASDSGSLLSYTRNDRKINELVYRHGAVPLKKQQIAHNVPVDLIVISREGARMSTLQGVSEAVNRLWQERFGKNQPHPAEMASAA